MNFNFSMGNVIISIGIISDAVTAQIWPQVRHENEKKLQMKVAPELILYESHPLNFGQKFLCVNIQG